MKEPTSSSSSHNNMIDGNWVLKRKRKRVLCRSDLSGIRESVSLESTGKDRSTKPIPSVSRTGKKIKGNDGYYYVCEECNHEGNLLCCDSCPRTYHLDCLKPALKRAPAGKWYCPSCSERKNQGKMGNLADSVSKRARTKVPSGKSMLDLRSSGQMSTSGRNSSSGNYTSDIRGKSVISQTSDYSQGDRLRGTKSESGEIDSSDNLDAKSRSTMDEVSKNGVLESKLTSLFDRSVQKARRKRHKNVKDGVKIKPMLGKDNQTVLSMRKPLAVHCVTSSVMNSEGIPERSSIPGSPRNEDTNANEKAPGHDPAFQDNQQVDRILGCRVQGCDASWSLTELTKISSKATGSELENNSVDNGGDVAMLDKELCSTTGLLSLVKGVTNVEGQSQNMEVAEPEMKSNCFVVNDLGKSHYLPKESSAVEEEHTEKVLECRDGNSETSTVPKDLTQSSKVTYEFFVKWLGQSNIHNTWIPENQLKVLAKRKLENYKAKYGTSTINICEEQWTQPQRVIGLRELKNGVKEAFVKWRGLPYDECTWERLDEPVVKESSQLIVEFNQFESQALQKAKVNSSKVKSDGQDLSPILEQPKELKGGLLFPHQLEALNWLRKCWHKSKNVILADEMGLGKTVSACAFISSLYHEFKAKLPCLVLVPLSTMPNWLAEFSLWAPHLNVVEYHGCAKARAAIRYHEWHPVDFDGQRLTSCYKFNVLLTTYEMVLADASHLRCISWEVLIVDEGHRLKNSGSKLFSLLNTFSFQHRVLLTGTPLQNNIGEMYNLLNFLQPASFPSLSAFEEKFNDLTTTEKVEELKKLVSPHMLRRLKKDAMQNIPPKTERMAPVELTSIQAEYYRAMLTKNYQILRNIGKGVAQQSMLNIVMQLRKVCNHPYLIPGTEPDSGSVEFLQEMRIKASGKLALLHSMLKILHKEGHRVLIFSQMTKLLDILEDYLTVEYGSKSFERVDGSVSVADRQTAIARFNQDKSRFVFLLSTRSCGLGINLATADTVIIYDSDFNPHADIQAMNRAHRIGQSNRLLVYRLVVRASVEERILQLAKKKLMLDQLFVNKSETQKEVEDILRWGTEELFSEGDQNDVDNPKLEGVVAEVEHKGRRRSGGLGDVYQDKCTDVGNKIVWDENAITKLLDRSNLQASALENADADSENDLLGSVKSTEWNDDLAEEQGGAETNTQAVASDNSVQTFDVKDDNSISYTEENEWDRLLRVRWERYQNEEEESLGRGKRLRKAVSYKESFAQIASEALSESGNEEDEPVPEYTPAGHAFKAKFSRLRARQKERISRRNSGIPEITCSPEPIDKGEETLIPNKQKESSQDQIFPSGHSTEALNISSSKTARTPQIHGSKWFQGDNDQLPVLGLCAPNARTTDESISQKLQNFLGLKVPNFEERRTQSEFPMLPDNNLFSEAFNRRMKGIATGGGFSFNLQGKPPPEHKNETVTCSSSGPPFLERGNLLSSLQESLPKFPLPNFLPNLSLDMIKPENLQDSPSLPPLPLFNSHHLSEKNPRQKPHLPPSPPLLPPPLPENHRKVLDSILMRTGGSGTMAPPLSKKRSKADSWTEDELDSLWIGVRRHGRGSWEALLRDPKLKFSKYRLPEDLSSKWADEQIKILNGPSKSTPSGSEFPPLSDGMMTRALFGSRFAGNFHSHLTDIQLGSGSSEKSMSLMTWQPEKALPRVPVDFGTTLNKSSGELTSGANVLPHWLREAVGLKSTGPPPKKLELPPTVLAVAKSVKVLYERESSIIPPFIIPGQLPSPPKDPNKHLKKKRKMHIKIQQFSDGGATTSLNLNLMSPAASPLPLGGVGMKDEIISEEEGHCEEEEEGGRNRLPLEVRERKWGNVESGGSRLDIEVENVFSAEDVVSKDDENADDL